MHREVTMPLSIPALLQRCLPTEKYGYPLLISTLLLAGCQGLPHQGLPQKTSTDSVAATAQTPELYQGTLTAEMLGIEQSLTMEQALMKGDIAWSGGETDRAAAYYVRTIELANNALKAELQDAFNPEMENAEIKETDNARDQGYLASLKLAGLYQQTGQQALAERIYQQVVNDHPYPVAALEALGLIRLQGRQNKQAAALLHRAVSLWRQQSENIGEHSERNAMTGYQPIRSLNGLGVLADLSKDYQRAERFYREALTLTSNDPTLLNNLGYSLYLAGQWPQAESHFRKALNIKPGYGRASRNLALLYLRQHQQEEAISLLSTTMKSWEAFNDAGYLSLLAGNQALAEQLLNQALDHSPSHYELAWKNLGKVQQVNESLSSPAD
ncbi:tetratricopeptide repeat protein [Endozoicomonas sp. GU-1]|uniref:tetratricopeptide repeat protein n=1 Tax=Endozoicomonas sp. GU-1 TaxID=3009078 RepID=UPI0022B466DA|nr:tetratricopeptide repeat protein [Endozoicomonas sp. GU-1]WBA79856.1 tetratricopeptide repeat protein [Endozoicomonas sp. GU-1]WBA87431.1 tetratricopeptide repeat protein [Endozoicomonas sp. GU-1]